MPLQKGSSRRVVSANIEKMIAEGKPQKVAVAAALSIADAVKKKKRKKKKRKKK